MYTLLAFALTTAAADLPPPAAPPVADTTLTLTHIEDARSGAAVSVRGTVTDILDEDEFRLEDATGDVRVYIGWRNRVSVDVGETVTVTGVMDDDIAGRLRPELYASTIVRADGTTLSLAPDD